MDVELIRERRIAEMKRIWYGFGADCPGCGDPLTESPAVNGRVVTSCADCGYSAERWEH